jgi:hypothetical protein
VLANIAIRGLEDQVIYGTEYAIVYPDATILESNDDSIHVALGALLKEVTLKVIGLD